MVENEARKQILKLQMEDCLELTENEFIEFCKKLGITRICTCMGRPKGIT